MVATIVGIERANGRYRVTMDTDFVDGLEGEIEFTVGKPKKRRSLDANAYFHALVGKIADKCRMSKIHCKNIMLSRYGQYEFVDGKMLTISVASEIDMSNREDIHCSAMGYEVFDGKQYTEYAIMKPSHQMSSYEFSKLLDGTIDEAKELGIETITPAELERMLEKWKNYSRS